MKLQDGILPTRRSDLIPRDSLGVTLVKVVATLLIIAAVGFLVFRFSDKPLVLFLLVPVLLILVVAYWIPYQKRIDRSDADQSMGD